MSDQKPVYTVMETGPDYKRHFMGSVCATAGAVDYCIRQGLRWWKIPEDVRLLRRGGQMSYEVVVTPDLADPQMAGWQGNVPQYTITEHKTLFAIQGDLPEGTDPMRTDEGWPRKS